MGAFSTSPFAWRLPAALPGERMTLQPQPIAPGAATLVHDDAWDAQAQRCLGVYGGAWAGTGRAAVGHSAMASGTGPINSPWSGTHPRCAIITAVSAGTGPGRGLCHCQQHRLLVRHDPAPDDVDGRGPGTTR